MTSKLLIVIAILTAVIGSAYAAGRKQPSATTAQQCRLHMSGEHMSQMPKAMREQCRAAMNGAMMSGSMMSGSMMSGSMMPGGMMSSSSSSSFTVSGTVDSSASSTSSVK